VEMKYNLLWDIRIWTSGSESAESYGVIIILNNISKLSSPRSDMLLVIVDQSNVQS